MTRQAYVCRHDLTQLMASLFQTRGKSRERMMKDHMKPISIMTTLVAGFAFVAATDGAFARDSTGTRPISTAAGKPFNINGGTGKGVGGEANAGLGGSAGGTARPRRPHRQW
jgi:hypothetical protein